MFAYPDGEWQYGSQEAPVSFEAVIPAASRTELLSLKGPQAIERFIVKVEADRMEQALRKMLLHITLMSILAQVQCPLGDFGAALGINFDAVPFTVGADGEMVCRFVMPFSDPRRWN